MGLDVATGNQLLEEGNLAGAMAWFADALRLDRDVGGARASAAKREEPLKKNDHLVNAAQFLAGREAPQVPIHRREANYEFHQQVQSNIRKQLRQKRRGRYLPRTELGAV